MRLIVSEFDAFSSKFPLWSKIYVTLGEVAFPSTNWFDATSSVLEMWMDQVIGLICGTTTHAQLHFMDGAYYIDIVAHSSERATVRCIDSLGVEVAHDDINLLQFGRQLLSAVSVVTSFYEGYDAKSIQVLQHLSKKLKQVIRAL